MKLLKVNCTKANKLLADLSLSACTLESIDDGFKVEFKKSDIKQLKELIKSLEGTS